MKTFEGKSGIKATIIADSISKDDNRLTTFEVEYPRICHAELLTHRMLSRNAASSRAIPFEKMKTQLTGKPVRFGANVSGMQDTGEDHDGFVAGRSSWCEDMEYEDCLEAEDAWERAKEDALFWSQAFHDAGYHKQVTNRLTEPFQMIKVLITATEWANFFWLRNDKAADPTLHELARVIKEAYDESVPAVLKDGVWHLPYVKVLTNGYDVIYCDADFIDDLMGWIPTQLFTLEEAIKVSAARCAAVSFRNTDYTLEKSLQVYDRLVGDKRKHSSALEHQATPMQPEFIDFTSDTQNDMSVNIADCPHFWEKGVSHVDRDYNLWSGNFKGFIQHRKLIDGENHEGGV